MKPPGWVSCVARRASASGRRALGILVVLAVMGLVYTLLQRRRAAELERHNFELAERRAGQRRAVLAGELQLPAGEIANLFGGFIPPSLRSAEIKKELDEVCTFDPAEADKWATIPGASLNEPLVPCRHWNESIQRIDCSIDRPPVWMHPRYAGKDFGDCSRSTFGRADSLWQKRNVDPVVPSTRHPKITFVSALIDIGRYHRPRCKYLQYMRPLLRANTSLLLYLEPWAVPAVTAARAHFGLSAQTEIRVVKSWDTAPFGNKLPKWREDVEKFYSEHHKHGWQNGMVEHVYAEYGWVNHAKVGWLKRAVEENPFKSDFFFWIDAGYGQYQDFTQQLCPCLAIHPDKVTMFTHYYPAREVEGVGWKSVDASRGPKHDVQGYFAGKKYLNSDLPSWIVGPHYGAMHGGFWGGGAAGILRYHDLYSTLLDLMTLKGIVDDDQPVQEMAQDLVPEIFQILGMMPPKACALEGRPILKTPVS